MSLDIRIPAPIEPTKVSARWGLPIPFCAFLVGRLASLSLTLALVGLACQHPAEEPAPPETDPILGETSMNDDVQPLQFDGTELPSPVERPLNGGETHAYVLTLVGERYLHLSVDQRDIDVEVTLIGPDGEPLVSVDSPTGARGAEILTAVTPTAGEYRLEVAAYPGEDVEPGRYELKVEEYRDATEEDRHRFAGTLAFQEGEKLRRQATVESRRQAVTSYSEALAEWQALQDDLQEARTLYRLGWMYDELEELLAARDTYRDAAQIFRKLGDRRREGVVLNLLGTVELRLEDFAAARETLNDALRLFGEIERPALEAAALFNLGNLHLRRNDPQQALDAYRAGLQRARAVESGTQEARAQHNIGMTLLYQGQIEDALVDLRKALELRRKLDNRGDLAATLNRLGDAHQRLDELDEALVYLREALELRRADGNPSALAENLNSLGNLYLKQGRQLESVVCYQEALTLVSVTGRRHDEAVLLINFGQHHEKFGDRTTALAFYEQAIALFELASDVRGEAYARYASARVLHGQKAFVAARSHLESAISRIEELRPGFEHESLRMAFFATRQGFYELLIDVLMHLEEQVPAANYDSLALEINERRRARVLLDLLSEAKAKIRQGVDKDLIAREAQIREGLNSAQHAYLTARQSAASTTEYEGRQRELLQELEEARREVRRWSPRYATLVRPEPLKVRQIRRLLDSETLMLVYSLGDERSFLWSVSQQGLVSSHVLPPRAEIESLAHAVYRHWARVGMRKPQSGTVAVRTLGEALLRPVAEALGGRRLVIVADGVLQSLPFAALPDPKARERPLLYGHEITYLPSVTVLETLRRNFSDRKPAPYDIAVIADPVFRRKDPRVAPGERSPADTEPIPQDLKRAARQIGIERFERLPGTRAEAAAISALIPDSRRLDALGFDANRATVLDGALSNFKIIHFATHGFQNPRNPELSGLVLSLIDEAGNAQDGFLRLHEIYNLNLRAELVVLSACETGLGAEVAGEGMVGLTRSFMYAGVPRVIVSLWKVADESTAELMKHFYAGIFKNKLSPAAALRTAQLALSQNERWQNPYFWAPFVLQGEWLLETPKVEDNDFEPEQTGGTDAKKMDADFTPPAPLRVGERGEVASSGVNGVNGEYLPPPPSFDDIVATAAEFTLHPKEVRDRRWVAERNGYDPDRLLGYDIDPHNLASAGWGVVFAPNIDKSVHEALKPLLDRRKSEAGDLFKICKYPPGKSTTDFLASHGIGFGPVNPKIVPYYLLLVGDPRTLPFRFQYEIDMPYAVGRIHFDSVDEYKNYAESVVQAETATMQRPRRMIFFAPQNSDDIATHCMYEQLIKPLQGKKFTKGRPGWAQELVAGKDATKKHLSRLLGSKETPTLLFTATHGMGFTYPHERLRSDQGALLCQDWPGPNAWSGPIPREYYFAATDVPDDADLHGLVAFFFACYSAGMPREDSFSQATFGRPRQIAEYPFVSRLAQRLLGHPRGGALAVLGHVDRAWTTSISWIRGEKGNTQEEEDGETQQRDGETQVFESTIKALLDGRRIGFATEYLNLRYAEISVHLSNLLEAWEHGDNLERSRVERLYRANNDARNFVLLGDPAVRLPGTE